MAKVPDLLRARYELWVDRFAPELYRFAYRLTGSHQTAEDLVQETFTEAWRGIESQREPGRERAWLFQILRFRYAHHVHRTVRVPPMVPLEDDAKLGHPNSLNHLADRELMERGLAQLSPELRETFLMIFSADFTCRETAEQLKIPLGTVLSRLDSARKTLRRYLSRALDRPATSPRVPGRAPVRPPKPSKSACGSGSTGGSP